MNRNLNRRIHPIAEADGLSPKKLRNLKKLKIRFNIMKIKEAITRLREKVITLLGGVTKERCGIENSVMYTEGKRRAALKILNRMEELYGVPADEWCKEMYKFTSDMYESNDRIIQKYIEDCII